VRERRHAVDRRCPAVHVAAWIEVSTRELAAPSVKQRLAAIRHLFDWLVTGQIVPVNPAGSVRGPRHIVTSRQTPVLDPAEARALLDSIDVSTHAGLRDRALIGLMVYSFARVGAALGMTVGDLYTQGPPAMGVAAREGRQATCDAVALQVRGIPDRISRWRRPSRRSQGPLFHDRARHQAAHADGALPQANAYAMIRRRATAVGVDTKLGNHSFRATGITAYLKNGGTLERVAAMVNHTSTRARRKPTIAGGTSLPSMRSSGLGFEIPS
jgi:site-specific recombinase XerD